MSRIKNILFLFVFLGITGLFSSCSRFDSVEMELREIPLQFVLPAGDAVSSYAPVSGEDADGSDASDLVYGAGAPSLRAFGDPGTTEQFALPKYAYIFLVFNLKNGRSADIRYFEWKNEDAIIDDFTWEEVQVASAAYGVNEGDLIRVCNKKITELTPVLGQVESCHLYAAVSDVSLTLKDGTNPIDARHVPATETAVQNITFTVNDELQPHLQNIYSTPYNYQPDGSHYYCSLNIWRDAPTYNIMLYHVASRVDLMWNVDEDKQSTTKLSYLEAYNLYNGACYIFKPNGNSVAAPAWTSDYSVTLVEDLNVGTQWQGRASFYTIPYGNSGIPAKFPIQLKMRNGTKDYTTGEYYHLNKMTDVSTTPFAPWIRGQITVSTAFDKNITPEEK